MSAALYAGAALLTFILCLSIAQAPPKTPKPAATAFLCAIGWPLLLLVLLLLIPGLLLKETAR